MSPVRLGQLLKQVNTVVVELGAQRYYEVCRLTTKFSDRTLTVQHAGARDLFKHKTQSPAAEHFIAPGSLQR
jgi:hypothetical protein